jgi:DNA-binding transcriptional LysR family regulator
MISFKHEVFLEVARHLSFTKAAATLFISQPAITRHIKQLEADYQVSLFTRKGSAIALTDAGNLVLQSLRKAKEIERQLHSELSSHQKSRVTRGELKVGASTTVALYIIPPVLSAFRKKFPQVKIHLLNRNSENVLDALLNNEIDLGIIEGKRGMARVRSSLFLTDEVIPVCSPQSPLLAKKKFTVRDLLHVPVALRERGSGTLQALKTALLEHDIKLSQLSNGIRLGGTEALKNFIIADECLGFLPQRSVLKELADGSLIRINIEGMQVRRHFYFIQRHGEESHHLSAAFTQIAKTHYNIK